MDATRPWQQGKALRVELARSSYGSWSAADLGAVPHSRLTVELCGDAHLTNFGVQASPERDLMFDGNDFDETLPGPFESDVKRRGASFTVAGRHRGWLTPGVSDHKESLIWREIWPITVPDRTISDIAFGSA